MKIAELFVDLGLKGADKASKGLDKIDTKLESVHSRGLAVKAAIIGIVYGLERLTGASSQIGMDLHKFAATTGLSTKELQKWQFAAMKFDVTGEEVSGTIRGIQKAIAGMRLNEGAPKAMGLVGIDTKRADDTFYVLEKIRSFAKNQDPAIASKVLESFGITDNFFQFIRTSKDKDFNLGSRLISGKDTENLRKINVAWKEFWFDMKIGAARMIASDEFGELFGELKNGVFEGLGYVKELYDWLKQVGALKSVIVALGVALAFAFSPITGVVAAIALLVNDLKALSEGKDSFMKNMIEKAPGGEYLMSGKIGEKLADLIQPSTESLLTTQQFAGAVPGGNPVTMTNTFHVTGAMDKETGKQVTSEFEKAARQMPRSSP